MARKSLFAKAASAVVVGHVALFAMAQAVSSEEKKSDDDLKLNPAQETLLRSQLTEHYKCELEKVLFIRKFEIGKDTKLEGRILCTDQREVDFTQASPHQKFQLRLCQPTVC